MTIREILHHFLDDKADNSTEFYESCFKALGTIKPLLNGLKARKKHKCCECKGTIEKGDIYEHVFGKWDGLTEVYNTCMHCLAARSFYESVNCGCYTYGTLFVDLLDYARESIASDGSGFKALRFVVKMKRRAKS